MHGCFFSVIIRSPAIPVNGASLPCRLGHGDSKTASHLQPRNDGERLSRPHNAFDATGEVAGQDRQMDGNRWQIDRSELPVQVAEKACGGRSRVLVLSDNSVLSRPEDARTPSSIDSAIAAGKPLGIVASTRSMTAGVREITSAMIASMSAIPHRLAVSIQCRALSSLSFQWGFLLRTAIANLALCQSSFSAPRPMSGQAESTS
jgi:hypothetical protein